MSNDLLTQLSDYGAIHEERQSAITADEILGAVVPLPVHTNQPRRQRRTLVALAAAAVATAVVALPFLFSRTGTPPTESPAPNPPTTTRTELSPIPTVPRTTTLAPVPHEDRIRSAFTSYIEAINAGDADAAAAAVELLDASPTSAEASERSQDQTEFLIELGWDYALDECTLEIPDEAICALSVSSPLHDALGVDTVPSDWKDRIFSIDAIRTVPNSNVDLFVDINVSVVNAFGTWMTENDPESRTTTCAPESPWDSLLYTGECGAYLNSISAEVVASIKAGEG